MATSYLKETLPTPLDSSSESPSLFDGTTRLYTSYMCPFAQRVWIARNYKGLQDKIKLVLMDLQNRPAWYKDKVYPENRVDIAYIPFLERFSLFLQDVWKYDVTDGRPKLAAWFEEMNKIDAYRHTRQDP